MFSVEVSDTQTIHDPVDSYIQLRFQISAQHATRKEVHATVKKFSVNKRHAKNTFTNREHMEEWNQKGRMGKRFWGSELNFIISIWRVTSKTSEAPELKSCLTLRLWHRITEQLGLNGIRAALDTIIDRDNGYPVWGFQRFSQVPPGVTTGASLHIISNSSFTLTQLFCATELLSALLNKLQISEWKPG
jgi:hypothetical protein